ATDNGSPEDFLVRKHEGVVWALALLEHYRQGASREMPPMLPRVVQYAYAHSTPAAPDQFMGFVAVLDEILQLAATKCDLDQYASALRYRQQLAHEEWARHQALTAGKGAEDATSNGIGEMAVTNQGAWFEGLDGGAVVKPGAPP
ncbi:MAG: hypothetical protein ACO3Z6_14990, partial [Pseudomonadales bacterium]